MIRELIDPEWYDVAKAVCYLLGAGCCALSHWLGYRSGKAVGRREELVECGRKFADLVRRQINADVPRLARINDIPYGKGTSEEHAEARHDEEGTQGIR